MSEKTLTVQKTDYFKVPSSLLRLSPNNPRIDFGDMEELKEQIRENGVLIPLRGYRDKDGLYYVNIGNRRTTALQMLLEEGIEMQVPFILQAKGTNEEQMLLETILSNDGKSFTPLEWAISAGRFVAWGWKASDIAKKWGKTPAYIRRLILLNNAPQKVKNIVKNGKMAATWAMQLLAEEGGAEKIIAMFESGELEGHTANGEETNKAEKKRLTKGDIATVNSTKELKDFLKFADEKNVKEENKKFFKLLLRIINNEVMGNDLEKFFLVKR